MPSTADGAVTPYVETNIRSRHHSTAEQSCMQTTRQPHGHATMQQEGTSNKHQGLQPRATSSCCYDITLRQPVDTQTDKQTDKQIGR